VPRYISRDLTEYGRLTCPLTRSGLIDIGVTSSDRLGSATRGEFSVPRIGRAQKCTPHCLGRQVRRIDRSHHLELVRAGADHLYAPIELLLAEKGHAELTHGEPSSLLSLLGRHVDRALIDDA
jgi:hypothetical protein